MNLRSLIDNRYEWILSLGSKRDTGNFMELSVQSLLFVVQFILSNQTLSDSVSGARILINMSGYCLWVENQTKAYRWHMWDFAYNLPHFLAVYNDEHLRRSDREDHIQRDGFSTLLCPFYHRFWAHHGHRIREDFWWWCPLSLLDNSRRRA